MFVVASRRRAYERPAPGNPRRLTVDQHVHSKSCIKRFTDATNRVGVLERGNDRVLLDGPAGGRFCAKRVWDQRLEHGALFRRVEKAFHHEAEHILKQGTVANHSVITEYISLWQLRSNFEAAPPESVEIKGVTNTLTKEQEENLESRGMMFVRGSTILGRFVASMDMLPRHERNLEQLDGVRWGVMTAQGSSHFICPDHPACELYIPLTRSVALVAGYPDQAVGNVTVDDLNRAAFAQCRRFVFGHPTDMAAFFKTTALTP